ncbi:MAG: BatA domain-containing protein [Gemmataceae bacterium]
MSFVFSIALGGAALIGIPIVIHLIMRQKPRTLLFPAFQFLLQRHRTNQRKLRLRHLLLLCLRVLIIAGLFFALAQPLLFSTSGGLGGDHPVAVVFVFDTSPRMGYKASDTSTRLDLARNQAQKLLADLHPESKVLILDSGVAPPSSRKSAAGDAKAQDWAASVDQAGKRIAELKVRASSRPLAAQITHGLARLRDLATDDEPRLRNLPCFLCVFSDRTEGSWQASLAKEVARTADQIPPSYEGLQAVQGDIPELIDLLKNLKAKIPPGSGVAYPDETLIDALGRLQSNLVGLTPEDINAATKKLEAIPVILEQGRELLGLVEPPEKAKEKEAREPKDDDYRDRLRQQLGKVMARLRGVQCLFLDVGLDEPVDLALVRLETPVGSDGTPRTVFERDEKWLLRAVVRASGKDQGATVVCKLPGETLEVTRDFPADKEVAVPFEIDGSKLKWDQGFASLDVGFKVADALPFNNQRFLTVAIREPRRVLVIADDAATPAYFLKALEALRFKAELVTPDQAARMETLPYHAVYLFEVSDPEKSWPILETYVDKGGGLGIVPPRGGESAYNSDAAKKLMPATLLRQTPRKDPIRSLGAVWDLDTDDTIFQHPLLRPFRDWRNNPKVDVTAQPAGAYQYWEVEPRPGAQVLVRYRAGSRLEPDERNRPAVVELPADPKGDRLGKVLLLTTPLDAKAPAWTSYLETRTSMYVVLVGQATGYLAGDLAPRRTNFQTDEPDPPSWALTTTKTYPGFALTGPGVRREFLPPDKGAPLVFLEARTPGNYMVDAVSPMGRDRIGAFSVNLPSSEGSMARLPVGAVEGVFGPNTVLAVGPTTDVKDALKSYRQEPLRLLPYLMLALLLLLAGENLLANLFYRKESRAEEAGTKAA